MLQHKLSSYCKTFLGCTMTHEECSLATILIIGPGSNFQLVL